MAQDTITAYRGRIGPAAILMTAGSAGHAGPAEEDQATIDAYQGDMKEVRRENQEYKDRYLM